MDRLLAVPNLKLTLAMTVPKLDDTMGAYYIGVLFGAILFGVTTAQAFSYVKSRSWADPLWLRLLVLSVWCLECTHQIFISHALYRYTISNPFNYPHLQKIIWTTIMEVLVTGLLAFCAHVWYLTRVYSMSENKVITGALACLVVAELALSIVFSAKALPVKTFTELQSVKDWFLAYNVAFAATSSAIFCAYIALLHVQPTRLKSRYRSSLHRIVAYSLHAGLPACLAALGSLIAYVASPKTLVHAPFLFCLGRLYIVSMLSALNNTAPKVKRSAATSSDGNGVYALDGAAPPRRENRMVRMSQFGRRSRSRGNAREMSIHIDTVQYVNHDDRDTEDFDEKAPASAV
ncbi:hypothetical protein PENSPDRAFT_655475 [Peniophora sp. CONT]|nr:hypothetical protein PENSPDRAFT_655475 [Peniophora sp. CONT]